VPGTVMRAAFGVAVTATLFGMADPALAQGRLDARYAVSLGGVPIGKGAWVIDIADNQFTAAASGATAGLLRVLASGQGSGASRGYVVSGNPVPASFAASITSDKKTEEIRMTLGSGDVKDFAVTPELPADPERVPVTDAHFHGVSDPMTGSLLRVAGTGNPLTPQACQRNTPIFDGRMRYNLQFAYKRMEQVKAEKGYEGPVVVCAVYFTPVAGYIPDRPVIKYLATERRIEIAFVPIAGTRVLVPFRMTIPTPFGPAMLEATSFVTSALPPRVAKTN